LIRLSTVNEVHSRQNLRLSGTPPNKLIFRERSTDYIP
jgi:hypothetical protein